MLRVPFTSAHKLSSHRVKWRRFASTASLKQDVTSNNEHIKTEYDAIIVGGGHNGLVAAAYLQKSGVDVCVLERRHLLGGAAVTEEIIPGFKFSRASYVLSLLRPQVYNDLELKKHGLKIILRNPNSYTPMLGSEEVRSLTLGQDPAENACQISQFSSKDAERYVEYEHHLTRIVSALDPLLDNKPPHLPSWVGDQASIKSQIRDLGSLMTLLKSGGKLRNDLMPFYEFMAAPAAKILDRWFESEPLKATLATDSVIGAMVSPTQPGSGYVLLHHVMGELEGVKGAWGYVEGGMGSVSTAIARAALQHGASLFTDVPVSTIDVDAHRAVRGVVLEDGRVIKSKIVLSNATAKVTFLDLVPQGCLPADFVKDVESIDYTSPVTKINIAVNKLPNFLANPNGVDNQPLPHHQATIHLNCEDSSLIHDAYLDAVQGHYSHRPVMEMTIPSSVDQTVAPPGCHVVQLFTQYTPYTLAGGQEWTDEKKNEYADVVCDCVEQYCPGFKSSIVGRDVLTPPDIERVFGLTGGNIFQGALSLDHLYWSRPSPAYSDYTSPVHGLYLCGSAAHPGGGVMGASGRLAALKALSQWKK